jgi:hypothetical protein
MPRRKKSALSRVNLRELLPRLSLQLIGCPPDAAIVAQERPLATRPCRLPPPSWMTAEGHQHVPRRLRPDGSIAPIPAVRATPHRTARFDLANASVSLPVCHLQSAEAAEPLFRQVPERARPGLNPPAACRPVEVTVASNV